MAKPTRKIAAGPIASLLTKAGTLAKLDYSFRLDLDQEILRFTN
jgi:hypothetical protein